MLRVFGSYFSQILMKFAQIGLKIKLTIRRPSIRIIWTLLSGYQMPQNRPDSPDIGHQILSGYHSLASTHINDEIELKRLLQQ